ncbi:MULTISPECIES: DEAD/DEAH box helicase [unclassified Frankia]|uniref:DEAD/DEAH box helicase n=1 Tax=unclassified Frankia TaxID=2632575 RepID=UPI002AD3060C|nr:MULTISPECIES: SNF2-related protein [unclassified Frankia]
MTSPPPVRAGSRARDLLRRARELHQLADEVLDADDALRADVGDAFRTLRAEMVRRELATIPIGRLRDSTDGRLRLGVLERSGITTVLEVCEAPPGALQAIDGIGEQTAKQVLGAAQQIATAIEESLAVRVDLDPDNPRSTALLVALRRFNQADRGGLAAVRTPAGKLRDDLPDLLRAACTSRGRIRMLLAGKERRDEALVALGRVQELLIGVDATDLPNQLARAVELVRHPAEPDGVWADFERRAAEYYGLLGEVVDLNLDVDAVEGFLPAEITARVREQRLDDTFREVSLRGYQSFGARFALVQRRVIIGDEMGLGKTIQAIAAFAHLRATGKTHFLVVCPASVLINWLREVPARSMLRAHRLHGSERAANLSAWVRHGDVGITTFESLKALAIPDDLGIAMLVVDEAHYVKNPAAQRSKAVRVLTERAERVLFLTGTPLQNRVEEFKNLIDYLQPHLVPSLNGLHTIGSPSVFRKQVAPAYLRRNTEDVLSELPDLVMTDEWEEFGPEDFAVYRRAVAEGNPMAMRQAAYRTGERSSSSKLRRLLEIVAESTDNRRKVVIFSYFRGVLDVVVRALAAAVPAVTIVGPLTGSTPPTDRQRMVDRFSATAGPAVLVSQIEAGGVGLNIQAGSVVILCEPQVKPAMEEQAVKRCHRMGQVRSVQVHRILITDSVDQRMLEVLAEKKRLFDAYARDSEIGADPDAIDISDVDMARHVVETEQMRLGLADLAM